MLTESDNGWQPDSTCWGRSQWYSCYTDEHYFASVLSLYGRADQTDCMGHAIAADWSKHTVHPKSFAPEEVTAALCASCQLRSQHCGMYRTVAVGLGHSEQRRE